MKSPLSKGGRIRLATPAQGATRCGKRASCRCNQKDLEDFSPLFMEREYARSFPHPQFRNKKPSLWPAVTKPVFTASPDMCQISASLPPKLDGYTA